MKNNIWIYSDLAGRFGELAGAAAALGGAPKAIVTGTAADAEAAAKSGVAKVHALSADDAHMTEDAVPAMAELVKASGTPALVLVAGTRRGRLMAARLAVRLGAAIVSDVNTLAFDGSALMATHGVYGGLAQGTERVTAPCAVVIMAAGAADAPEGAAAAPIEAVAATLEGTAQRTGRHPKQGSTVELGRARRVVAVGRGLKAQADLSMVLALAQAIEAEMGCSRPLAEGEKWIESERYIGITGVKIKADLYLALGISGQIQHMAGVGASRTIVVVNKDKNCPAFQYADYGLVGDIYKVVPALTKLMG